MTFISLLPSTALELHYSERSDRCWLKPNVSLIGATVCTIAIISALMWAGLRRVREKEREIPTLNMLTNRALAQCWIAIDISPGHQAISGQRWRHEQARALAYWSRLPSPHITIGNHGMFHLSFNVAAMMGTQIGGSGRRCSRVHPDSIGRWAKMK